jgi:hypothetical protein
MKLIRIWSVTTHRTRLTPESHSIATCGHCGRSWDDSIPTSLTPAPSGRCPFESMHRYPSDRTFKIHTRRGFIISRTAGPDAPWRAWHPSGFHFRADTLAGAFRMASRFALK